MKSTTTLFLILFTSLQLYSQAFLHNPVEGKYGTDFILVNYVDWSFDSTLDHQCGSKSYDGHQGTDFVLRSFKQMDSGIYVLAAANGRVTFAIDTFYDREKVSVVSKKLGNYICIKHPNKYYTYYAHLKKSSALVEEGDTVIAGQRIAQIASSGNSSDPHLHMEVWYDSSFVVDPFAGTCGNANTLWINPYTYDTSFKVWEYGMHNKTVTINTLREREISIPNPYSFDIHSDTTLVLWSHMYGLKKGDTLRIDWVNPKNEVHFTYTFPISKDWWYYYFWSNIDSSNLIIGNWKAHLYLNGKQIIEQDFQVLDKDISLEKITKNGPCDLKIQNINSIRDYYPSEKLTLFDSKGTKIAFKNNFSRLPKGIYYLLIQQSNQNCYFKVSI